MGDRCNVTVHVKNSQREKFIELVGREPDCFDEDTEPGMSTLQYYEVNYAALSEDDYKGLIASDVLAEIWNGHGDEYGACLTLVGRGCWMDIESNEDGLIFIPWPERPAQASGVAGTVRRWLRKLVGKQHPAELDVSIGRVMQYVAKRDELYAEAEAEAKAKADADLGSVDYPDGSEEKGGPQQ